MIRYDSLQNLQSQCIIHHFLIDLALVVSEVSSNCAGGAPTPSSTTDHNFLVLRMVDILMLQKSYFTPSNMGIT